MFRRLPLAQSRKATNDAAITGVALIVFWPALLFMKGDGASANNVAELKGQMNAITSVNDAKDCGIQFAPS